MKTLGQFNSAEHILSQWKDMKYSILAARFS